MRTMQKPNELRADELRPLLEAREHDPFHVLGLHREGDTWRIRVFNPHAHSIALEFADGNSNTPISMLRIGGSGIFEWHGTHAPSAPWRLHVKENRRVFSMHDPYAFPPQASDYDLHLFSAGENYQSWRLLGALPEIRHGVAGICFRVWAPNAERVSVVGDFNHWDGRCHPLASLGSSGVWELFIPDLPDCTIYKFELRQRGSDAVRVKADPYARAFERRPATAAKVVATAPYQWHDAAWLEKRARSDWLHAPMSVYEMHAGAWMRHADNSFYNWRELVERLVPYLRDMHYTHVELLPIMEHPLDESWGYQCTGFFAPSARFGSPDDFRFFVDACHQADIGVILDWVPGHFPADDWALAHFDGSALYEHEDPQQKMHPDWGTYIFNYARNEVRSFLMSSAHWWLSAFHADGLRVDAVASMLYLDYSRKPGEWTPNKHGGRENLEAIAFLQALNQMVHREFPGALTIAEESTAWPQVSRPVDGGGLGFSMKWNMGWMNDTLAYFRNDPVHRRYHHDKLTFGQLYAYSENFVLPFSHDEVVHGKGSLLGKMPGDEWQRFANLRLLLAYQMATPGRKLNFMGNEFGQSDEWTERRELPWHLLQHEPHRGVQRMMSDLNRLYRDIPALHQLDFEPQGFVWLDCNDVLNSLLAWQRRARDGSTVVVVANFTPVPRMHQRIGLPQAGRWHEIFNSDSVHYGGGNVGNGTMPEAVAMPWMGQPAALTLSLPPLALLILAPG
ncbi:MAG TPA: 1,4-alpha-glucan branching protein GlgB [Rhodocyclaceae bacterium]|nr:1,4-alpha-glucan branching protein GlgB [Rhodocyclaceae bacterium]